MRFFINELIFEVYELSGTDREQVETKMGKSVGSMEVLQEAKEFFLLQLENPTVEFTQYIDNLPLAIFEDQKIREIKWVIH